MMGIFLHLATLWKLYKTIRDRYTEVRPIFAKWVVDSETKIDDKVMRVLDVLFKKA